MNVAQLIEFLKTQPQDALIVGNNPRASDEGLGHWFEPRYLHLVGVKEKVVDGKTCLTFKYSEENDGWQDDSWDAVDSGRFFKVRGLDPNDFVWAGEEKLRKMETISAYASTGNVILSRPRHFTRKCLLLDVCVTMTNGDLIANTYLRNLVLVTM